MSENFGGNECCDAEDDSGVDWGLYVLIYCIVAGDFGVVGWVLACMYLSFGSYSSCIVKSILLVVIPISIALVCALFWPVVLFICCIRTCSHCIKARQKMAALRRRDEAISYLSQLPPEAKQRWLHRGWFVMLRVRHQIYLAQQHSVSQMSRVWLCRRNARDPRGITLAKMDDPLVTAGGERSAGTQGVIGIELCEEGNSNQETARLIEGNPNSEFARAVVSVIGIIEEGLFRHIVLYL